LLSFNCPTRSAPYRRWNALRRDVRRSSSTPYRLAVLVAAFLFSAACSNEKPASQSVKSTPAALLTTTPSIGPARHVAWRDDNPHTSGASGPPIFLIFARTYAGDLVSGTCFYLERPKGRWIITANHVIKEAEPDSIVARVGNASVRLRAVSQDQASDLAALLPSQPIPNVPLILRSTSPHRGEVVAFTGFPIPDVLGASSPATVQGPVTDDASTVGGKADFKIAAPATGGDSGAPVLDAENSVVGVVVYAAGDRQSAYAVEGFNVLKLLGEVQP
jgi:S1-C subfamily serine protease